MIGSDAIAGADGSTPGHRHHELVERLREAVLGESGETESSLRRAVEARAASFSGRPGAAEGVPPELTVFVDKVAREAYRVTPEDLDELRRAGWSEDELFELLASAALGAASGRLERGLAALRGEV